MAPRKKKLTTKRSRKAKSDGNAIEPVIPAPESIQDVPLPETVVEKQAEMLQHKKFGKYRCLLEPTEPTPSSVTENVEVKCEGNENVDGMATTSSASIEEVTSEIVNSNESVDIKPESSSLVEEMEVQEDKNIENEIEIANQLCHLKVSEEIETGTVEMTDELKAEPVSIDEPVKDIKTESQECISPESIPVVNELELGSSVENIETTDEVTKVETPDEDKVPLTKGKSKKSKAPAITEAKKVVKKRVQRPRKDKKVLEKTHSDTSESSVTSSENSVRRSSRIKSISVLKQKVKGQGLAKLKAKLDSNKFDSDTSENSNSGQTDSEKTPTDSPNFLAPKQISESESKPVKVKSRWRRSSELEMGSKTSLQNAAASSEGQSAKDSKEVDLDIRSRLKQFVHLKENQYLTSRLSCKVAKKMVCDCNLTAEEIERGESGCGEDCLNRLLMIECGQFCPLNQCTNKRFQKSQFSPCEVFRTDKKGLGIRATANIPYGEFILEYIGEVIGPDAFEERATEYSKGKNPHYYFMSLRSDAVIDATQKGNISRFINHSCEPNAETQKWTVNGELRIGFFSRRTILAGEEITFDYQFQRYGKEAQKCFCEATTCRGWLGEEPDEDDEDEEEEDEEEEEEEEEEEQPKVAEVVTADLTPIPTEAEQSIEELLETSVNETDPIVKEVTEVTPEIEEPKKEVIKKPTKREKRKVITRKVLKDIFDDVDVDEEIEMLVTTGLKNQAHTLKLSRLMVRANQASQRTALLRILRRGELPCRRLFLDYHGLRLIHGWMNDAQQMYKTDKKQQSLRLELLQTLATLPIPNKTMLQDNKVLPTVEKWSISTEEISPEVDSESNSPKIEGEAPGTSNSTTLNNTIELKEEPVTKDVKVSPPRVENSKQDYESENEEEIRRSVGMDLINISTTQWSSNEDKEKFVQELIDMFEEDFEITPNILTNSKLPEQAKLEERNYEIEIVALALKLLEEWTTLKEVFRIPKKERIEQMKEHEREADKGYKAGLEHDPEKKLSSRYNRRKNKNESEYNRKNVKVDDRNLVAIPKISKHERRKLFAMQVEHEEGERRMKQRDMWRQHELNCMAMGTDPRFTAPFDPSRNYHCIWNQQTGQWQNFSVPINQTPILNTMVPRFNTAMHFPYPTMPPPVPNMPQPLPNNSHQYLQPNMSLPPPHMPPHQSPILPHQSPNLSHSLPPMNHPPPVMNLPPPNMNLPHPGSNLPHPGNSLPHLGNNLPHPGNNLPHPGNNLPHPGNNMPHPGNNLPHPGNNLPRPANSLPHPGMPPPKSYDKLKEEEDLSQVKFAGPIPPPAKLPPKWKCAKDKYGRPYYYHIKIRISQWEPPEFIPLEGDDESSDSTSSSDTSSLSSDTSSEEDSDDDLDDTKLLINVHKKIDSLPLPVLGLDEDNVESSPGSSSILEALKVEIQDATESDKVASLDERLKEEFNLKKNENSKGPPPKRRRIGLVTEIHLISPRSEEDKLHARENLRKYKENKEKLKRQKEVNNAEQAKEQPREQIKKRVKVTVKAAKPTSKKHKLAVKAKLKEVMELNTEAAKKIKESFRSIMASVMVGILNPYRKPDCKEGKITNTEDFKHLARKLTHFVMLKELKHCQNIEDLTCTESVKSKAKEFVRKYMSKFGENYTRPIDDLDY